MEAQTITPVRTAENVGQPISRELASRLMAGFRQKFPAEKPAVFIAKETIEKALEGFDNVSGIRFMYGIESVNNAESRILLLIPCNNTSTHLNIPNAIILPQGYMDSNGMRTSFEKTWQILYNHTLRYQTYFPELTYNQIMRGSFMGINSLLTLLQTKDCAGINFNFGFDDTQAEASAKTNPFLKP